MTDKDSKLTVRVKPSRYQPSKAELNESIRIGASPEDIIRAAFRQVKVVEDPDA